jgi:glycosyltransferase involved in cell wall biosynthesis
MNSNNQKYVIISPVRDEEEYLPQTLKSMINQTIRPTEYILVDDGSTDQTAEIIKKAARDHSWIHYVKRPDRGARKVGPGVIEAFYDGYTRIETDNYDYIGKMDGDLSFGPKYFETLFEKFDQDPYLGGASGKLFLDLGDGQLKEERHADEMVIGGMQFYRRKCFDAIGGFIRQVMWDGIAYHRCRMEGWRTQSFRDPELMIHDHRLMGSSFKSIYHGRIRWGWGQYFMGTHPVYIMAIGLYRMWEKPLVVGGILIFLGYLKGWLTRTQRYDYPGFRKSLHAWQFERLKLGKRLERIPTLPLGKA